MEAAAVIGVKDQYADEEIIAFIQLKEGMKLEETEVRSHLRGLLANFKIPKQVIFQDELPRNAKEFPNLKIYGVSSLQEAIDVCRDGD